MKENEMNVKAAFWTAMTVAALAGLIIMLYAILTAPAYIAIPVAIYLGGVAIFAIVAAGRHVVRHSLTT
jgi:hypothetical protein